MTSSYMDIVAEEDPVPWNTDNIKSEVKHHFATFSLLNFYFIKTCDLKYAAGFSSRSMEYNGEGIDPTRPTI